MNNRFAVRDSCDEVTFEIWDGVCIHSHGARRCQVDPRKIRRPDAATVINFNLKLIRKTTGLRGEKLSYYRVHGGDIVRLVEKVGNLKTKWWELYQTRREELGLAPLVEHEEFACC